VHEHVELTNCRLGAWTEVGANSWLENVELGDYSYTGPLGFFQNTIIGKFSNIAANVRIGPTMHPMDRPTLHHFTYRRRAYGLAERDDEEFFAWRASQVATIGHDTWIGHGAIIMPGVAVGDGAVVGSGAVVTKDVPAYTVVVGVPAKFVRERFDPATADVLQKMRWWDWTHQQLEERLADFSGPVNAFIEKWGRS
jgi:phosphonate metabolism protein (transferase hexapeptide repeat family)